MNHIWPEVLSVAAIVGALASVFISYKAYRIAAVQALPRLKIGGMATWGASRSVAFEVEWNSRPPGLGRHERQHPAELAPTLPLGS